MTPKLKKDLARKLLIIFYLQQGNYKDLSSLDPSNYKQDIKLLKEAGFIEKKDEFQLTAQGKQLAYLFSYKKRKEIERFFFWF